MSLGPDWMSGNHEIRDLGPQEPFYNFIWRVWTRLPDRFGTRCRVLVRGGMNSCLVEFEADGYRVVTSRNYVRRPAGDRA